MQEMEKTNQELSRKLKAKRSRKAVIAVILIVCAALLVFGTLYRSGGGKSAGTVSVEITCSALAEDMDRLEDASVRKFIPADGILLKRTEYELHEGDTVYDCLVSVCRENDIAFVKSGTGKRVYISSIGHLEEFDGGKNSGWMYEVNGEAPNVGCGQFELSDRDAVVWYYTVDYKKE